MTGGRTPEQDAPNEIEHLVVVPVAVNDLAALRFSGDMVACASPRARSAHAT
jgi:hypothetical protein